MAVLPTKLENTDQNQEYGNSAFDTEDWVFLYSSREIENQTQQERLVYATDYAVMCGASLSYERRGDKGKRLTLKWCRSAHSEDGVHMVNSKGAILCELASRKIWASCPALRLDLASFISARSAVRIGENEKGGYHTVTIGLEFPKSYVGIRLDKELTSLKNSGQLKRTGARYTGFMRDDGSFVQNEEYEYNGEKYVRVEVIKYDSNSAFDDDTQCPETGAYTWAKVEPISFRIINWDDLPRSINPKGNGTAKFVEVETEEGIISRLPFYPEYGKTEHTMWQNSVYRAYLNGYNLHKEIDKRNGNIQYKASKNFNFEGKGFLFEASQGLGLQMEAKDTIATATPEKEKQSNPYGFTFEKLDNDELLKQYVKSNAAIFLHGPSGVGKSGRIKQLDPTATRITLRPQMNPEEVDGTLDRETGKYIPPLWYTQLCEKCKAEPGRKHILFIDELTNVKPTVQSLIYSIVLDRAGKDGLWPLPDNAVVVAAGNESADNLAAYPLTNALFRRFSHIYYEVDKNSWLDWAIGVSKVQKQEHVTDDKTPRARIHPAIVAYIMSREEDVLNQDLDEENPHIVTDPRKWEIASNVLYTTKKPRALKPAIGEELTEDFVDFVQNIHLTVEDVVKGRYDRHEFEEMDISRKRSTIVGLCMASEKDLPAVREFIFSNMGKEILTTYDLLWIRNDPERAEIIAECGLSFIEEGEENGIEF